VLLLAVFGKRPDVFTGNLFRSERPRLIFGRPDRYLRSHYVKPFLVAAYVSVGFFIAAVLSVLVIGLWGRA
jgi:hypothetical protein